MHLYTVCISLYTCVCVCFDSPVCTFEVQFFKANRRDFVEVSSKAFSHPWREKNLNRRIRRKLEPDDLTEVILPTVKSLQMTSFKIQIALLFCNPTTTYNNQSSCCRSRCALEVEYIY